SIGKKVQDDLFPHIPIDVYWSGKHWTIHNELETRSLDRRSEDAGKIGGCCSEIRRLIDSIRPPGFDARKIEQRIDESQKPETIPLRDSKKLPGIRKNLIVGFGKNVFDGPEHQRERSSEFVAHIAEERCFRPVQLRQRFGPLPFFLVCSRVGKTCCN